MDLENSLITTWKDTQVLGMCLPAPTMSETPGLVVLAGGWGHSHLPTLCSCCPRPDIWGRTFPHLSPLCPSP